MEGLDPRILGNEGGDGGNEIKQKEGNGMGRRSSLGGCLPKNQSISTIHIRSEVVRVNIELWKETALIGKFVGILTRERDLVRWIQIVWNPKGHYDLQLGSKGFFTIIFLNQEDRDRILEGERYLFFSTGLYLKT